MIRTRIKKARRAKVLQTDGPRQVITCKGLFGRNVGKSAIMITRRGFGSHAMCGGYVLPSCLLQLSFPNLAFLSRYSRYSQSTWHIGKLRKQYNLRLECLIHPDKRHSAILQACTSALATPIAESSLVLTQARVPEQLFIQLSLGHCQRLQGAGLSNHDSYSRQWLPPSYACQNPPGQMAERKLQLFWPNHTYHSIV